MESKEKNVLTILLIIIVVIIIGIIGYLAYEVISQNSKQKQSEEISDEFDRLVPTISEDEYNEQNINNEETDINQENRQDHQSDNQNAEREVAQNQGNAGNSSGSSTYRGSSGTSSASSGVNVSGYWVLGTIRIPATGIKYSVFSQPTRQALERGVSVLYTANELNQPGNTVIVGHNYRNRLFFSKNKNLKNGDKVIIKDASGLEITYTIYNKFTTNSGDASFFQRDTGGKREITLSTCTDQGTKTGERLIIFARAD